jgi:hypothetical protein
MPARKEDLYLVLRREKSLEISRIHSRAAFRNNAVGCPDVPDSTVRIDFGTSYRNDRP